MFICHLLNDHIDFLGFLSLIGYNIINHCLRKANLFHVLFYKHNYSSALFFPRALSLVNLISDDVDFFLSTFCFRYKVYNALNNNSYFMNYLCSLSFLVTITIIAINCYFFILPFYFILVLLLPIIMIWYTLIILYFLFPYYLNIIYIS